MVAFRNSVVAVQSRETAHGIKERFILWATVCTLGGTPRRGSRSGVRRGRAPIADGRALCFSASDAICGRDATHVLGLDTQFPAQGSRIEPCGAGGRVARPWWGRPFIRLID
ncbi:hypothetical protein AURDEDRAFT_111928 [Auricularia subglabra TFB-10046 SS5]|nr:hypothetical protein AURDEDRAFT_111928 [Auricularia subglabra TFB-10046 SS5]